MSAASLHSHVPVVVAIDGPSGSGKSTVSRRVAEALSARYLDTGAMYRATAVWCLRSGVDLENLEAVASAVAEMPLRMVTDPAAPAVMLADDDIEEAIRASEVSRVVSLVATNQKVRAELIARQRAIIAEAVADGVSIVAEGRDITTVVAPDATARILLTAREDVRLARRALQNTGSSDAETLAATHDEVVRRDRDDSTVASFLTAADGVTTIDGSDLDLPQVIAAVLDVVDAAVAQSEDDR